MVGNDQPEPQSVDKRLIARGYRATLIDRNTHVVAPSRLTVRVSTYFLSAAARRIMKVRPPNATMLLDLLYDHSIG